jgi:hypothetical protein
MNVFRRERDYFGQSPLDLTDRFCNAVNQSLVDAVDTFQLWVSKNLVTFSMTQCKRVLSNSAIGTTVTSTDISNALREVITESTNKPATSGAVLAAHAYYKNNRRRPTGHTKMSGKATEDDLNMLTAGQLLEAAANLGLNNTISDVNDIGVILSVDVFREVQRVCDVLMTSLRQTADKTCDKFELYLLNNVFHIPEDLHVPGLDKEEIQREAFSDVNRYTENDERVLDNDRAALRDTIIKLRRQNARLARTQTDLHVKLERWEANMMPLVESVAENVGGGNTDDMTENDHSKSHNLADAVRAVLRDSEQLSNTASEIQSVFPIALVVTVFVAFLHKMSHSLFLLYLFGP